MSNTIWYLDKMSNFRKASCEDLERMCGRIRIKEKVMDWRKVYRRLGDMELTELPEKWFIKTNKCDNDEWEKIAEAAKKISGDTDAYLGKDYYIRCNYDDLWTGSQSVMDTCCGGHTEITADQLFSFLEKEKEMNGWIIVLDGGASALKDRGYITDDQGVYGDIYLIEKTGNYHALAAVNSYALRSYELRNHISEIPPFKRIKYLTTKQIQNRMAAGADPVELTIEKYSLLAEFDKRPDDLELGCRGCPLCIDNDVIMGFGGLAAGCFECPLYLVSGLNCFDYSSIFRSVVDAKSTSEWKAACTAMVDALKRYQRIKNA